MLLKLSRQAGSIAKEASVLSAAKDATNAMRKVMPRALNAGEHAVGEASQLSHIVQPMTRTVHMDPEALARAHLIQEGHISPEVIAQRQARSQSRMGASKLESTSAMRKPLPRAGDQPLPAEALPRAPSMVAGPPMPEHELHASTSMHKMPKPQGMITPQLAKSPMRFHHYALAAGLGTGVGTAGGLGAGEMIQNKTASLIEGALTGAGRLARGVGKAMLSTPGRRALTGTLALTAGLGGAAAARGTNAQHPDGRSPFGEE